MIPPTLNNSTRRARAARERGAAMITALVSLMVVATFATTLLTAVDNERQSVTIHLDRTQNFKYCEGGLTNAEKALVDAVAGFQTLAVITGAPAHTVLQGSATYEGITATWAVKEALTVSGGIASVIAPWNRVDPVTGLQQTVVPYTITSTVSRGTSKMTMTKRIELEKVPIFQFLSYYDKDLEILPGPAMTLNGRIHTNEDLYVGPGTSLSADTKYFRAAGDLHRYRKDDGTMPTGWIKVRDSATGGALVTLPSKADLTALSIGSTYGVDSSFTGWDKNHDHLFTGAGEMPPFRDEVSTLFNGTLETGEHGVKQIAAPSIGSIQAFEAITGGDYNLVSGAYVPVASGTGHFRKGYYHSQAGLVIRQSTVYTTAGLDITALMPAGFLTTTTLYDGRQNRTVTLTKINLAKLGDMDGNAATRDPSPYFPLNGLIFIDRNDATPSQPNGVMLTGGSQINIPAKWNTAEYAAGGLYAGQTPPVGATAFTAAQKLGVTVVSPDPVYVQGDFNTISRKPCSVLADAVNLLSNAWNGTKTSGSALPAATATTYNLAMITGNLATTPGSYNGGFENLPRFHEDWAGVNATIMGSFVRTWDSQLATAAWQYGGHVYTAPNRIWSFDPNFDANKLPPFTPMVVGSHAIAWEVNN